MVYNNFFSSTPSKYLTASMARVRQWVSSMRQDPWNPACPKLEDEDVGFGSSDARDDANIKSCPDFWERSICRRWVDCSLNPRGVLAGIEMHLKIQLHRISIEDNIQIKGWDIGAGCPERRGFEKEKNRRASALKP
jgi:hypothetical protein